MKSEALTIPRDGGQDIPSAEVRDAPLGQLAEDADVPGMVSRILDNAGERPRHRGTMFSSAI
jgi:hypothetical protein